MFFAKTRRYDLIGMMICFATKDAMPCRQDAIIPRRDAMFLRDGLVSLVRQEAMYLTNKMLCFPR